MFAISDESTDGLIELIRAPRATGQHLHVRI